MEPELRWKRRDSHDLQKPKEWRIWKIRKGRRSSELDFHPSFPFTWRRTASVLSETNSGHHHHRHQAPTAAWPLHSYIPSSTICFYIIAPFATPHQASTFQHVALTRSPSSALPIKYNSNLHRSFLGLGHAEEKYQVCGSRTRVHWR